MQVDIGNRPMDLIYKTKAFILKNGIILCWALLTPSWDPLQVLGVYKEMALRRGRDYEGGRHVALYNFVKRVLYKRILI